MALYFSPPEWEEMLENMYKNTKSLSIHETAIKLHTRWYLTPAKPHTIYPAVSPHCPETGFLLHIFWSCKYLQPVWQQAATRASTIAGHLLTLTLQMCIFFTSIPDIPVPCQKLIHTLFMVIHWAIHWVTGLIWCSYSVSWS